ncbi:hypothetical protein GTX14_20215 [Streptomyces sp. SID4944]|nr:hypothetical protein [Streptomyces sp. SID4944]
MVAMGAMVAVGFRIAVGSGSGRAPARGGVVPPVSPRAVPLAVLVPHLMPPLAVPSYDHRRTAVVPAPILSDRGGAGGQAPARQPSGGGRRAA